MKLNKHIIIAFLGALVLMACEEDYKEPSNFTDVGWYSSQFRKDVANGQEYNVGINKVVSFADVSINEESHSWSIPRSAYFIGGSISSRDSVFEDKKIHVGDTSTTDKIINVVFTESGWHKIVLRNVFSDSVAFRGHDTIPAVEQPDGSWLYEHVMDIKVYDTIQGMAKMYQNGVEITPDVDTVYVENGGTLELVDFSTNEPNTRSFRIGNTTSSDSSASLVLKNLGVFTAGLSVSRQGEGVPNDWDKFNFPNIIKVTPSSLPFEIAGPITETEDEIIQVPFSGEFANFFVGQNSFVTVSVNGTPFSIASLGTNSADGSILEIKLNNPIYRPDVITVSLADGSAMTAADTRTPVPFTDVPVDMFKHLLMDPYLYGFEDGGAASWAPHAENKATTTISVTNEQAASGTYSLKMVSTEAGNWSHFETSPAPFHIDAGTLLQYRYKFYIPTGSSININGPWIQPESQQQYWMNNTASAPKDEWYTFTSTKTTWGPAATADNFYVSIRHNSAGTIYYDDIEISAYEARP